MSIFLLGSGLVFPAYYGVLLDVSGNIAIGSTTVVVYILLLGSCCVYNKVSVQEKKKKKKMVNSLSMHHALDSGHLSGNQCC
jgi:hypothetical protein